MKFIPCATCGKVAMRIADGSIAKGCTVRCPKCEEKLKKELQNLRYLVTINENKNPFGNLFG